MPINKLVLHQEEFRRDITDRGTRVEAHNASTKINQVAVQRSDSPLCIQIIPEQDFIIAVALKRSDNSLQNEGELFQGFKMITGNLFSALVDPRVDLK